MGLGQAEEMSLENQEQLYRIDSLVSLLREHKESLQYLGLTLADLLSMINLPSRDEEILVESVHKKLRIGSSNARISDAL